LKANPELKFVSTFHAVMTGTEIVLTASGKASLGPTIRIPSERTLNADDLDELRDYIIAGLETIV